ncbi:MAG TPA: DUF1571 domain-containing protein [Gemmataceae bacterium]|nr:DUF1571 domain-containing protein [Gemmataceae bacterium]
MFGGKDVSRLLLVIAVGLLCVGCQNGPDRNAVARGRRQPPPYPDQPAEGAVRAAAPLRITEPPTAFTESPRVAPPAATAAPQDAVPNVPADPAESPLRRIHRLAAEEYARIDGYYVRLTRREQVNGKDNPKEVIRLSFRKEPWSVHFVWLEGETKGREVIYVKGRYDDKLHTRLGPNDHYPFFPPGSRLALDPDSSMVRSSSRHRITNAGAGSLIDRFGSLVVANEKGDKRWGTLTYLGPQKRPEFDGPVEAAEQVIPPGAEKDLPRGGRRLWMFDTVNTHLPALLSTTDDRGHEVEYYLHDHYSPTHFEDKDFDPNALWGKS